MIHLVGFLKYLLLFLSTKKAIYFCYFSEDSTLARHFNDKQAELEICCLSCLWDFSETKEDRSLLLRKIGLEPIVHSLLKDIPDVVDDNRIYDVSRANERSLGCLGGYEI